MKDNRGNVLEEGQGGFLVLLGGFGHVGYEPWCSRVPHRSLVAAIIQCAPNCTGMIDGLAWTGFGLHALHTCPVRTALGCREGYRPVGHGGTHVPGGPQVENNIIV